MGGRIMLRDQFIRESLDEGEQAWAHHNSQLYYHDNKILI
jgi:hypothetical protein